MAPTAAGIASIVAPAHELLGIASAANAARSGDPQSGSKRPRKERCPNWNVMEVKSLIEGKRDMLLEDMENNEKDARRSMASDHKRWQRISNHVMKAGFSSCLRDGAACKSKWNQLLPEFKRLADFIQKADPDEAPYWTMLAVDRKRLGLPKSFPLEIYNVMQQWFGTSASMAPPHLRDLTSGADLDLTSLSHCKKSSEEVNQRHGVEASKDADAAEEGSDDAIASTKAQPAPAPAETSTPAADLRRKGKEPVAEVNATKGVLNGICVVNLSSSGGVADCNLQRPQNTGVKRKSINGHSLIANATVAAGEAMSQQMRDVESRKMELQKSLFGEQMQYQRDRDARLERHAKRVQQNAKLSIEKQGELTACLADLCAVMSGRSSFHSSRAVQHEIPRGRPTEDTEDAEREEE